MQKCHMVSESVIFNNNNIGLRLVLPDELQSLADYICIDLIRFNRQIEQVEVNRANVKIILSIGVKDLGVFIVVLNKKPKMNPDTVVSKVLSLSIAL
ncbi:MAG TPA: hypothetical protein VH796_13640 [Nitrososphaeraceae archaeon]